MTGVGAASVGDRLGVRVDGDAAPLLGLALRRNPKRAQLLVSRVLGKHIPTDPRLVRAAGLLLGGLVADALIVDPLIVDAAGDRPGRPVPLDRLARAVAGDRAVSHALHADAQRAVARFPDDAHPLVLGFAETATALGHCVAEGLGGAPYLHSTRRPVAGVATAGGFTEEHSHATDHLLLPRDPGLLHDGRVLVLVDDELSTGRTVLNTITALHRLAPRRRYVVAALVDVRPPGSGLFDAVRALGARLDIVSLARARVHLPADVIARARALRAELDDAPDDAPGARFGGAVEPTGRAARPPSPGPARPAPVPRVRLADLGWPAGVPAGGRHGFSPDDHRALAAALPGLAAALVTAADVRPRERTLVLGTEELMALPLRLAQVMADAGHDVVFSSTTRSPAVVVDTDGYALRNALTFPAHDEPADGPGPRFAYNVAPGRGWDHVLVVVDPPADTPALRTGLLAALAPHARRTTVVLTP